MPISFFAESSSEIDVTTVMSASSTHRNGSARGRAVLVVDDEPLLRMMAADVVEAAGLECIEAANADEAITILEGRPDIGVVFTDVHMPGTMDGIMLANYVRRRWPPVELIVTSGVHRLAEFDLPSRGVFFAKPYRREQIVEALQGFIAR